MFQQVLAISLALCIFFSFLGSRSLLQPCPNQGHVEQLGLEVSAKVEEEKEGEELVTAVDDAAMEEEEVVVEEAETMAVVEEEAEEKEVVKEVDVQGCGDRGGGSTFLP